MKIEFKNIKESPLSLFRQAGYIFQHGENKGEMSFVRFLARAGYPRFHIYATLSGKDLIANIHLDQKKETYGKNLRHHGEYGNKGPLKEEVQRLQQLFG
ncbi:MAG: hypothetical protein A2Z52_00635 [Candidatus Moranbacteria bacterium RBG_19FT_COMBO_42_6]|nr:MAG: hypothetical protein A2Z52_00635 [Candidatus Moranbacteria bacterium RBG_19FT_COMBO_42_6]